MTNSTLGTLTDTAGSARAAHGGQHDDEAIRRELHAFIRETFLLLRPALQVGDTDDLVDMGVLDSLAFVELVAEIQIRYDIVVRDVDITRENFGTIAALASYLRSRCSM